VVAREEVGMSDESDERASTGTGSKAAPPPAWFEPVVTFARGRAKSRVASLRAAHPGESDRRLGERLERSQAWKTGLAGGVTSTVALVTLPVGLPAGIATTLALEAELLLSLLELYGLASDDEVGRARLLALWAGAGFVDAVSSVGLKSGAVALGAVLAGSLPVTIIRKLPPALVAAILKRLGLSWTTKAARLWPLLGAPVGFAVDFAATRALGRLALDQLDAHADARSTRDAAPRPGERAPA